MVGTARWLLVCTQKPFKQATISCKKHSSLVGKQGVPGSHVLFFFSSSSTAYMPAGHCVGCKDANMLLDLMTETQHLKVTRQWQITAQTPQLFLFLFFLLRKTKSDERRAGNTQGHEQSTSHHSYIPKETYTMLLISGPVLLLLTSLIHCKDSFG